MSSATPLAGADAGGMSESKLTMRDIIMKRKKGACSDALLLRFNHVVVLVQIVPAVRLWNSRKGLSLALACCPASTSFSLDPELDHVS